MARKSRVQERSLRKNRRPNSKLKRDWRACRLDYEALEDRRMLSINFNQLAEQVAGTSGYLASVTTALNAINSVTRLPLINEAVSSNEIGHLNETLETFRKDLYTELNSLAPNEVESKIQSVIFELLDDTGLLADNQPEDVTVKLDADGVEPDGIDFKIDFGITSDEFASALGLGIDSVPFKPADGTDGDFFIGLRYEDFNFGYNTKDGFYFKAPAENELQLKITGDLPQEFTAGLGFFNFSVTDKNPGNDLELTLIANITDEFSISTPSISGFVDFKADLNVQVEGSGLPQVNTTMLLKWDLPNAGLAANTAMGSAWGAPTLHFDDVKLNIGSLLDGVTEPIAKRVRDIIEPLEPVFDLIEAPIPGLSDIAEGLDFVDGGISLLDLSKALEGLPQTPQLANILNSAVRLRDFANTVTQVADAVEAAGGGWINFGDFEVGSPTGNLLTGKAPSPLGSFQEVVIDKVKQLLPWSDLQRIGREFSFEDLKQEILSQLPDGVDQQVNQLWDQLAGTSTQGGLEFTFPIVTNPDDVVLGMLLGQDKDLITVKGTLDLDFDKSFDINIIPFFDIHVKAQAFFDAKIEIGYDTFGLRKAVAPLFEGKDFDTEEILDGLWIGKGAFLNFDGAIGLGPQWDAVFIKFNILGNIESNLHATIANPNGVDRIRPFNGDLDDRLFDVSGEFKGTITGGIKVGVEAGGKFWGYQNDWEFGSYPIYNFPANTIPIPGRLTERLPRPEHLYYQTGDTLFLSVGDEANRNYRGIAADTIDEHLTVEYLGPFPLLVGTGIVFFKQFEISGFGITQRFLTTASVISAHFEDGEDSLKVVDHGSGVRYTIHGGSQNDLIDIDGEVDAQLFGDDGMDTLDAGSGNGSPDSISATTIHGGKDSDTISFGDGRVDRMDRTETFLIVREEDDTSRDRLTVDNSRSTTGQSYYFEPYDDDPRFDLVLNINYGLFIYMTAYDGITLYAGRGDDVFYNSPPAYSRIYGGAGDDKFIYDRADKFPEPAPASKLPYNVSLYGGKGRDTVFADDSATQTDRSYSATPFVTSLTSSKLTWRDPGTSAYSLQFGGIEDTRLSVSSTRNVQVDGWTVGDLLIDGANEVQLAANSSVMWEARVQVIRSAGVKLFDRSDSLFSAAGVDALGPYIVQLFGNRIRLDVDEVTTNFSFDVDYAILDLSPELLAKPWNLSFESSTNAFVEITSPNYDVSTVTAPSYHYRLDSDRVEIGPKTIFLEGIGQLVVNSGQGHDQFQIDHNPVGTVATFNGGFGNDDFKLGNGHVLFTPAWRIEGGPGDDTLTLDNRQSTLANMVWGVEPGQIVIRGGIFSVGTEGVETINLLGGAVNDEVRIIGVIAQALHVDTGDGHDTIYFGFDGFENVPTFIDAPVNVEGGEGDDTYFWNAVNNVIFQDEFAFDLNPVVLVGGNGYNALVINDQTRGGLAVPDYDIDANRIAMREFGSGADFLYDNFDSIQLNCSENADRIDVYGTATDIDVSNFFTIYGNGGADYFSIVPHDSTGNLTIGGNLAILGGNDLDKVVIDDTASLLPINYLIYNEALEFGTRVAGLGSGKLAVSGDIEDLDLRAGKGDDDIRLHTYVLPYTALSIAAGEGNDVLDLAPVVQDLSNSINDLAEITFDGGAGSDSYNVFNRSSSDVWSYFRSDNSLDLFRVVDGASYNYSVQSFESMQLTGGTKADSVYISNLPGGDTLSVDGAGGLDALYLGFPISSARNIQGQVVFDGGDEGGTVTVYNGAETAGSTFHIEEGWEGVLGSWPGDNLFGSGGSLHYRNLADGPDGFGLNLFLGSGADRIYAAPQTAAAILIDAGDPSTAPGDKLNLELAHTQSPAVQNTGVGSGRVTSSNRKPIEWRGIEGLNPGYVAPTSFVVTNTLDSGPGSLRQALLNANATPNVGEPDLIRFSIPGVGAHTIRPVTLLPGITDPVVLDGTTQPGYTGTPVIELDGSLGGGGYGLFIYSGGSTIRGLAINRFVAGANSEIWIQGPGGNVIQGNYLGTNLAGNAIFPLASQASYGVVVFGSDGNIIGTNGDGVGDMAEGNVISGHNTAGILLETGQPGELPDNNVIAGNRIGTSANGNSVLANARMGVFFIGGGTGNRIGTNSDGVSDVAERNLISGNTEAGIFVDGDGNVIAGNYIGTNLAGTGGLPNGDGIRISGGDNNLVGGTAAGAGNVIAFSTFSGVLIDGPAAGNSVLGNSIFSNGRMGINLNASSDLANGVSLNDSGDADTGPNNLQNFPTLSAAIVAGGQTIVGGSIESTPQRTFRVEFFASPTADPSGYGEGQTYLGFVLATTDNTGRASFVATLTTAVPVGQFITATATDSSNSTSEFSAATQVAANSLQNVVPLRTPTTQANFLVSSPAGTSLTATAAATPGVALPLGVQFPFGYVDFVVQGLAPGSTADVTISGLDASLMADYYKYGPTRADSSAHWYNFLFGQQTDVDSAVGTGMEIVGGNLVLHLVDGGRGDDDRLQNGVIVDIGGPALANRTQTILTSDFFAGSTYGQLVHFTATVSAVGGTPTGSVQFKIDGANIGLPKSLSSGQASLDISSLSAIDHAITALYSSNSSAFADSGDDFVQHVNRAPLAIKADNKTKTAGTANPPLTFTAMGFVNGDTTANLAAQPTLSTTAVTSSPAGAYPITANGAASPNYTISYTAGTLTVTPPAGGTIRGKTVVDVTGNGLTADDTPQSGLQVYIDANNNGSWNTSEPSMMSLADGTYAFTGLSAGTYRVRQVVPTGFVRTAPATSDLYTVTLATGQTSSSNDFANAQLGNLSVLSNVVFVVNGVTPVSDLRGKTKEGDTIQVSFTIAASAQPQRFTLVSYTAPSATYDANTASQQAIFDADTGVFGPGTHTLTVTNPHSYFQNDFVSGYAIDRFGAANSNIFYGAQGRLISADNGGTRAVRSGPASLTGAAYLDANNNGVYDSGERPIAGATVALTGAASQTAVTDVYGVYMFDNLPAGSYTVTETQPTSFSDGIDTLGNKGGTRTNDKFSNISLSAGAVGTGYNFGELQSVGTPFTGNQTQSVGWWNGSNGQALIKALNGGQSAKNLGNWLATNFSNLFGAAAGSANNLTGKTNTQVAAYYKTLYSNTAKRAETEFLALALATYVTDSSLAGSVATSYGFAVSAGGLGRATVNIGMNGAAFGVGNHVVVTLSELLSRTNSSARKGLLWDEDSNGSSGAAEGILRNQASALFAVINNT